MAIVLLSDDKAMYEVLSQYAERSKILLYTTIDNAVAPEIRLIITDDNAVVSSGNFPHIPAIAVDTKPLRVGALCKRIDDILARQEETPSYDMAGGYFSPQLRTLSDPAKQHIIHLTEKESALLLYLLEAKGEYVSSETLYQQLWGYNTQIDTHTLQSHIYRLRQKMEQLEACGVVIQSDEKKGYACFPLL